MIYEDIIAILGQIEIRYCFYLIAEEVFGNEISHLVPAFLGIGLDFIAPDPALTLIDANKLVIEWVLQWGIDSNRAVAEVIDIHGGYQMAGQLWKDLESWEALVVEVDLICARWEVDQFVDDKGHEELTGFG